MSARELLGRCVNCLREIREGDLYHHGVDEHSCEECAPTWRNMLEEPGSFVDLNTDEHLTAEQVQAQFAEHAAAGGSIDDRLVSR